MSYITAGGPLPRGGTWFRCLVLVDHTFCRAWGLEDTSVGLECCERHRTKTILKVYLNKEVTLQKTFIDIIGIPLEVRIETSNEVATGVVVTFDKVANIRANPVGCAA